MGTFSPGTAWGTAELQITVTKLSLCRNLAQSLGHHVPQLLHGERNVTARRKLEISSSPYNLCLSLGMMGRGAVSPHSSWAQGTWCIDSEGGGLLHRRDGDQVGSVAQRGCSALAMLDACLGTRPPGEVALRQATLPPITSPPLSIFPLVIHKGSSAWTTPFLPRLLSHSPSPSPCCKSSWEVFLNSFLQAR